ncbi:MAG: CRISPR-associated endoribonuclease Cas2 [Thermoanaerobaculia bacterium]|nr:CRISPR-associated endoribonuclease Cas2 [Thermoanaerobaculia bacterium]
MRTRYIVTYDVCDPKRLRRVFKVMKGAGDHLQLSVFRCDLSDRQLEELKERLGREIHAGKDQVLFVEVGPSDGGLAERIWTLGKPYEEAETGPVIV